MSTVTNKQAYFNDRFAHIPEAIVHLKQEIPGLIGYQLYGRIAKIDEPGVTVATMFAGDDIKVLWFPQHAISYIEYDSELLNEEAMEYDNG